MKITHLNGDCGYYTDGNTFDTFMITQDDHTPIAVARLEYRDNGIIAQISAVDGVETALLPGCAGDLHFVASVTAAIIKGFGVDDDFYYQQFYDEDGDSFAKDFELITL